MSARPERTFVLQAAEILSRGGLVAFPTETVYGLGADAANADAVGRLFAVKGRPAWHPVIVHLASADDLSRWTASVSAVARRLTEALWPGPLTVVLPRSHHVPDAVTGGKDTVGLRVPAQPLALELLGAFGGGVAAPSANRFGRLSPTTAADVVADLGADVDLVLDGGPCTVGVESTVVDCTGRDPIVLRPGGATIEQLEDIVGGPIAVAGGDAGLGRAPGTLPSHYAPRCRVVLAAAGDGGAVAGSLLAAGLRVAVLAEAVPALPVGVLPLDPVGDPDGYARLLYARLREADALGVDVVVAVPPAPTGIGRAVLDRLTRAAATVGSDD